MNTGIFSGGAGLVWRRQSVLWWIFAVNLLLGLAGTLPMASKTGAVLDYSLEARHLVYEFDVAVLGDLARDPSRPLAAGQASLVTALVFFVFVLFIEGGVLEVYRLDRKLTRGEFFGACGTFFWRFARLTLSSLILIVPIFLLAQFVVSHSDKLATDAPQPMLGVWFEVLGLAVVTFLLIAVRLWFDLAQVDAVRERERAMRRSLRRAARAMRGHFWSLFWMFLRISLVAWIGLAVALFGWVKLVRPEWIGVSFLLSQAVLLLWLGARLWQRASETLWYERQVPLSAPAPSPPEPPAVPPQPPEPIPEPPPEPQVRNPAQNSASMAERLGDGVLSGQPWSFRTPPLRLRSHRKAVLRGLES